MTPRIIRNCTALTGYDTYPHVDMYERAFEAAEILVRIIRGEITPVMALECPPLLTPLQTQVTTRDTPMKRIIDLVHQLETDKRVISIAAFGGFPFADIEPQAFPVSWSPMAMPTWQRVLPGKSPTQRSPSGTIGSCIPHRQKRLCVVWPRRMAR